MYKNLKVKKTIQKYFETEPKVSQVKHFFSIDIVEVEVKYQDVKRGSESSLIN